jgi:hypothetical protein
MNLLQVAAIVVSLATSAFAVARVLFVTEVKVDQHDKRLDKVEGKADGIDKEVTGPHNARVVKLAGGARQPGVSPRCPCQRVPRVPR